MRIGGNWFFSLGSLIRATRSKISGQFLFSLDFLLAVNILVANGFYSDALGGGGKKRDATTILLANRKLHGPSKQRFMENMLNDHLIALSPQILLKKGSP